MELTLQVVGICGKCQRVMEDRREGEMIKLSYDECGRTFYIK